MHRLIRNQDLQYLYYLSKSPVLLEAVEKAWVDPNWNFHDEPLVATHVKIDRSNHEMEMASAGMGLHFILRQTGALEVFEGDGLIITLTSTPFDPFNISYSNHERNGPWKTKLLKDDLLVISTDGFTDRKLKGTTLSIQQIFQSSQYWEVPEVKRFLAGLRDLAGKDPAVIQQYLIDASVKISDDIVLAVHRYNGGL